MAIQPITINLPDNLYQQLRRQADLSHRSVEEEVLQAVTASASTAELPSDLEGVVSQLDTLDDYGLWRAARNHLAPRDATRMERLHLKRQREGLNERETLLLADYVRRYERIMLIRARAALLLKKRGYDLHSPLP
jgi:plasmid stability protein